MTRRRRRLSAAGVLWVTLVATPLGGAAQLVARAGPGAGTDLVCEAALRRWASGEARAPGLMTYGTRFGAPTGDGEARRLRGSVGPAALAARGDVLAGAMQGSEETGYVYPGPGPAPADIVGARFAAEAELGAWAFAADLVTDFDDTDVRALGAGWRSSAVGVWGGAVPLRSGPTCRGSLVLGGGAGPAHGAEAVMLRPVRLPLLGSLLVGTTLGRLDEAGPGNEHPIFHAMRIEVRPHPDLSVGLQRAVVFGGSATSVPVTPRTVGLMLVGIPDAPGKDSDFENQVAAVDLRWRSAPWGRPLLLTAEWGADDSGYAFLRVPGIRVTAAVRGAGGWTGVEVVHMAPPVDDYPSWYRHGALAWGWTDRGVPLGSPLAGEGTMVAATWGRAGSTVGVEVLLGLARRGPQNLLAAPDGERVALGSATLSAVVGGWQLEAAGAFLGGPGRPGRMSASLVRRLR